MYFFPISLPKPQQNGYSRKYAPNILRTQMSDGYVRQRLVNQGAPDVVSVSWMFNADEFSEFLTWYKGNIHSGADWFVCPLLSCECNEITYQYCRIQKGEFTQSLLFRNEETAMYKITCSLDVSNTVVDDGSWSEHYGYKGATDDEYGNVLLFETSNIAGNLAPIEDDVDTENTPISAIHPIEDDNIVNINSVIEDNDETSEFSIIKTIEINTEYEEA